MLSRFTDVTVEARNKNGEEQLDLPDEPLSRGAPEVERSLSSVQPPAEWMRGNRK